MDFTRRLFIVTIIAAALFLPACSGVNTEGDLEAPMEDTNEGEMGMEEVTVTVVNSAYKPTEYTVQAGTTVTWVMNATFPHTVTADDASFNSGSLSDGQSFSFTFDTPGEYPYYCAFHGGPGGSGMSGTVTVTE